MSSHTPGTVTVPASDADFDRLFIPVASALNSTTEDPEPASSDATTGTSRSDDQSGPAAAVAVRLEINRQALRQIGLQACLHSELEPLMALLEPALASQAVATPSWLLQPEHPARQLLRRWLDCASGWQPELGRGARQLVQRWQQLFENLTADSPLTRWLEADAALRSHAEHEAQRLARLEERLHAAEQGHLKTRRARAITARLINQSLGGRPLPAPIVEFIHTDWLQCVQQLLIRHGESSDIAARLAELSQQLVWSMQPQARSDEHRQRLYAIVPDLAGCIREQLLQTMPDQDRLERIIGDIGAEHLRQLQGEPLQSVACPLVPNDDPILGMHVQVSKALLRQVGALHCGQWFWFADGDHRARLSLKLEETSQLLFINALGTREGIYSFEEFAYRLSSGRIRPQPGGAAVDQVLDLLLSRAVGRALDQRAQDKHVRDSALRRRAEALHQQQQARNKALEEAQLQAEREKKAQFEAEQAAQELEQARRDRVLGALGDTDQRERSARQLASMLEIGSWVEFFDPLGASQKLKLAVKLPSSDKMIFVDRDGGSRLELNRSHFVERLAEGSAGLLEYGSAFDDTLAKVVGGLRRGREKRSS